MVPTDNVCQYISGRFSDLTQYYMRVPFIFNVYRYKWQIANSNRDWLIRGAEKQNIAFYSAASNIISILLLNPYLRSWAGFLKVCLLCWLAMFLQLMNTMCSQVNGQNIILKYHYFGHTKICRSHVIKWFKIQTVYILSHVE